MNMAKTKKAAKKKNTPTTLANESTPRLKKTKKQSLKFIYSEKVTSFVK